MNGVILYQLKFYFMHVFILKFTQKNQQNAHLIYIDSYINTHTYNRERKGYSVQTLLKKTCINSTRRYLRDCINTDMDIHTDIDIERERE